MTICLHATQQNNEGKCVVDDAFGSVPVTSRALNTLFTIFTFTFNRERRERTPQSGAVVYNHNERLCNERLYHVAIASSSVSGAAVVKSICFSAETLSKSLYLQDRKCMLCTKMHKTLYFSAAFSQQTMLTMMMMMTTMADAFRGIEHSLRTLRLTSAVASVFGRLPNSIV